MLERLVLGLVSGSLAALAVALVFAVGASPAHAALHKWQVTMDEAQALSTCSPNPAPANSGGSATVVYDDVTNQLDYFVQYHNLSGGNTPTLAHFHGPAARGADAGVQVTIPSLATPYTGTATLTATQEGQLLSGLWYINYHTSLCPGGEIRGQVDTPVGGYSRLTGIAGVGGSGAGAWLIAAFATAALAVLSGSSVYAWRRSLR